jgi:hypothetical protein
MVRFVERGEGDGDEDEAQTQQQVIRRSATDASDAAEGDNFPDG